MTVNHNNFLSRTIVPMVFGGLAALGGMLAWAQVSAPQPAPQGVQNRGAVDPRAPINQQTIQQANQGAPATNQGAPATSQAGQRQRTSRQNQQDAAWLGVFLNENKGNETGATVTHVYPSGPGARAGLQPGDVIQQFNGKQIATSNDLVTAIEEFQPGDKAEIIVLRNNAQAKLSAALGSRNAFIFRDQSQDRYGGQGSEYDEDDDYSNVPLYAMELEHNRRNAEQHQRIENEIAQLREEVRMLREALQKR